MKAKVLTLALFAASTAFMSLSASAQDKKQSVGTSITKTADAVGNKVSDQQYKGKMAPDGSNVYINGKNRKYYVNKKGRKVYLKTSQILTKPASK
jgi:hypothetical protein